MSREWKPGDVAMLRCRDGVERVALLTDRGDLDSLWIAESVDWGRLHDDIPVRPLVVIDPEDNNAVSQLIGVLHDYGYQYNPDADVVDLAAALREFANPKPPKPDEPTEWLSVVVDADGDKWVRDGLPGDRATTGDWWNHSCAARGYVGGDLRAHYPDVDVVRVLSEGVQL